MLGTLRRPKPKKNIMEVMMPARPFGSSSVSKYFYPFFFIYLFYREKTRPEEKSTNDEAIKDGLKKVSSFS